MCFLFSTLARARPVHGFSTTKKAYRTAVSSRLLSSLSLLIESPEEMHELGALLSVVANQPGDVVLLGGDLGAGKTCLSRGFVQNLVGESQSVTSPTYLLCNSYPIQQEDDDNSEAPIKIHHMDLYRLSGAEGDLLPLNLPHVFAHDISLIEWPDRLGNLVPPVRLELELEILDAESADEDSHLLPRKVTMTPFGAMWKERLESIQNEGFVDDWMMQQDE